MQVQQSGRLSRQRRHSGGIRNGTWERERDKERERERERKN